MFYYERYIGFYGAASGQVINFSKPGVFFSANVPFHQTAALSELLGVSSPLNTGKYLGLPSLIGRNKRSLFHHIKERLWKRIQSWNGKFLSITGREVLLKSILQSVSTYHMSAFLLPQSLLEQLQRTLNSIWWGSIQYGKKQFTGSIGQHFELTSTWVVWVLEI